LVFPEVTAVMTKLNVIEICSNNGEIHFVLQEYTNNRRLRRHNSFSYAEVKKTMKKEAAKPLLLLRKE
jgi:hypothetical protein